MNQRPNDACARKHFDDLPVRLRLLLRACGGFLNRKKENFGHEDDNGDDAEVIRCLMHSVL
jgi:hypothetical protein